MVLLLTLLPVLILLLAALGILVLRQFRPSIGYAWLIGAVSSLVTVGAVIFLRWRIPLDVVVEQWRPFGELSSPPAFRLDINSWPYVLSLAVLALGFIFTDSARLETEAKPMNWAKGLAILALGMLSVMAVSPITLVLIWTAVDLVEFFMVIRTDGGRRMGEQVVLTFTVRVAGTLLVLLAVLLSRSLNIQFDLAPIPVELAVFMLLAVGLRLGVLPLNLLFVQEVYAWRGLGNVMRMVGPASSLAVLGRMPEQVVPVEWQGLLLVLSAMAAVYGAAMFMAADNELSGRPYWSIALAAMAVASVINGSPRSSIAWGAALLIAGSVLFFYSARMRQIIFIPLVAMVGITGLPFTPAASGWIGVVSSAPGLLDFLFIMAVICLLWGYARHVMRRREELYRMERWVHTVYIAGLVLLILAQWAIGVLGWRGSFTIGVWWASAAVAVIAAAGGVLAYSLRGVLAGNDSGSNRAISFMWVLAFARRAAAVLAAVFRLNWLYRFIGGVYAALQYVVQLITAMLEGDGGILWSLVMLAMLISLIRVSAAAVGALP